MDGWEGSSAETLKWGNTQRLGQVAWVLGGQLSHFSKWLRREPPENLFEFLVAPTFFISLFIKELNSRQEHLKAHRPSSYFLFTIHFGPTGVGEGGSQEGGPEWGEPQECGAHRRGEPQEGEPQEWGPAGGGASRLPGPAWRGSPCRASSPRAPHPPGRSPPTSRGAGSCLGSGPCPTPHPPGPPQPEPCGVGGGSVVGPTSLPRPEQRQGCDLSVLSQPKATALQRDWLQRQPPAQTKDQAQDLGGYEGGAGPQMLWRVRTWPVGWGARLGFQGDPTWRSTWRVVFGVLGPLEAEGRGSGKGRGTGVPVSGTEGRGRCLGPSINEASGF